MSNEIYQNYELGQKGTLYHLSSECHWKIEKHISIGLLNL